MASNFLRFISVCVLSLSASQAFSVSFDANKYDIYSGDLDGDGVNDIYFHGKEQLILLHDDIITPIVIQAQPSYALYGVEQLTVENIPVEENQNNEVVYVVDYRYYAEPVLVDPSLTDQEILDQGLVALVENDDYFVADFNNDGNSDILLRAGEFERAYIIAGSDGNNAPTELVEYTGEHATLINNRSLGLTIVDGSYDGYLDISFPSADPLFVDRLILGGGNYKQFGFESIYTPALPASLVGVSGGSFRVDESGAATYAVGIEIPAGVAGVQPSVGLSYSSQGSNSIAGLGWGIAAGSAITRCHDVKYTDGYTKPIKLNGEDKFCLNGSRLVNIDSDAEYAALDSEYKTEIDSFSYIYSVGGTVGNPAYFEVIAKDGSRKRYGYSADSRIELGTATFSWVLSSTEDNLNNAVNYNYVGGTQNHRLDEITYAGGEAKVKFHYGSRPDVRVGYIQGYKTESTLRLDRIEVTNSGDVFRDYRLTYLKATEENKTSRLYHIQECADEGANCLAPLEFTWQSQLAGISETADFEFTPTSGEREHLISFKPADINGDGCQDIVYGWAVGVHSDTLVFKTSYSLSTDNCTNFLPVQFLTSEIMSDSNDGYHMEVFDYNVDGYSDIALRYGDDQYWKIFLSRPNGDDEWRIVNNSTPLPVKGEYFIDIDGDGLTDNLDDTEVTLLKKLANVDDTTGLSYGYAVVEPIAGSGELKGFGDFDGDGSVDFIRYKRILNSTYDVVTGIGDRSISYKYEFLRQTSSGVELIDVIISNVALSTCSLSFEFSHSCNTASDIAALAVEHRDPIVADINGDGLSDVIVDNEASFVLYLNLGDGFSDPVALPVSPSELQLSGNQIKLQPSLVDYNRDGNADLYWHDRETSQLKLSLWDASTESFGRVEILKENADANSAYTFADVNGDGANDVLEMVNAYDDDETHNKSIRIYTSLDSQDHNLITEFTNSFGNKTTIHYERMNISSHYSRVEIEGPQLQPSYIELNYEVCIGSLVDMESQVPMVCRESSNDNFYGLIANPLNLAIDDDELHRPVFSINSPTPIVVSVESSAPTVDDADNTNRVDYIYTDGRMQAGGRGFLGFETLSTVDVQTGVMTTTQFHQDYPLIGRPKVTHVITAEGELLKESHNRYTVIESGDRYQIFSDSSTEAVYPTKTNNAQGDGLEVGSDALIITTITTTYDGYGNLLTSVTTSAGESPDLDSESGTLTFTQEKTITSVYGDAEEISLHGKSFSYAQLGRLTSTVSAGKRNSIAQEPRGVAFTYYANGMLDTEVVEPIDPNKSVPDQQDLDQNVIKKNYYDSFGNILKTELTAWNGSVLETRKSEVKFDSSGRYPIETYDVYGQLIEKIVSRNAYGAPTVVQGTNGVVGTVTYDALGRELTRTNNLATSNTASTEYLSCGQVSPACPQGVDIEYAVRSSAEGGGVAVAYFDALGRSVRSASLDFNGSWVYTATEYDNLSRAIRVSHPYYYSPEYWTSTEYDMLGRALSISVPASEEPFAVSTIVYDGLTATTTNPDGQTKRETKNTFGQLIKVEDNVHDEDNTYAYIRYAYNIEGNLTTTTVHKAEGGTVVTYLDYDRLGRKTSMDDPDKGHWEYRYNAFGELTYQQDAKLQVVRNTYDKLGRITSRIDYKAPEGGQAEGAIEQATHWYFDGNTDDSGITINNAIGQTTAVVMSRGVDHATCDNPSVQYCQYPNFDEFGRQIGATSYINSDNIDATPREMFTSSQTYSAATARVDKSYDVMHDLLSDDGAKIASGSQAHYNEYGYLTHTTDLQDSSLELYRTKKTNVRGQVTEAEIGGYGRTIYYNDITGRLEKQIAYVGGLINLSETPDAFTIQHITYEWDIVGNLKSRKNQNSLRNNGGNSSNRNLGESFCYDSLNRLVKTNIGTTSQTACDTLLETAQDQRFDSIGNITYKNGVGNYSYNSNLPHAVTNTSNGLAYFYDSNGNMTSDNERTFAYSTFDKPLSIDKGDHTSSFEYGPGRNRYLHIESNDSVDAKNTTTLYIGNVERLTFSDGSMEWRRSVAGGLRTYTTDASYNMVGDEVQRYIFKDHLGSIDVIADAFGNIDQPMSFNPWGERRKQDANLTPLTVLELFSAPTDITSRGYTGHEMLDELGLIHMNGRIYDAKLARFVQADPFIQAATDVQMYNRYSYLRNNPMNATDPSGYLLKDLSGFNAAKKLAQEFGFTGGSFFAGSLDFVGGYTLNAGNKALAQNDTYAQWAPTIVGIATAFCGPCSIGFTALATADISYYRTGSFTGAVRAGGIAGAFAAMTYGVRGADYVSKVLVAGMAGGLSAVMQGGRFGDGFAKAGFSAAVTMAVGDGDIVSAMLVSGTVSHLTGGKFSNGAISAAISYIGGMIEGDAGGGLSDVELESSAFGNTPKQNKTSLTVSIVKNGGFLTADEAAREGYIASDNQYINTGTNQEYVFLIVENNKSGRFFYTSGGVVSSNNKVTFKWAAGTKLKSYGLAGHAHTHPFTSGKSQEGFSAGDNVKSSSVYPRFVRTPSGNAYVQSGYVKGMLPGSNVPLSHTPSICLGGTACLTPHSRYK